VIHRSLPEALSAEGVEGAVCADDHEVVENGLGGQQTIEWVSVMANELTGM